MRKTLRKNKSSAVCAFVRVVDDPREVLVDPGVDAVIAFTAAAGAPAHNADLQQATNINF